jgi:hypothetical protein
VDPAALSCAAAFLDGSGYGVTAATTPVQDSISRIAGEYKINLDRLPQVIVLSVEFAGAAAFDPSSSQPL